MLIIIAAWIQPATSLQTEMLFLQGVTEWIEINTFDALTHHPRWTNPAYFGDLSEFYAQLCFLVSP